MDEQNVHHFWGISPALDLGSLLPDGDDAAALLPVDQPVRILQVAPYDARHTLTTMCRAMRHTVLRRQAQPVQLVVWEDSPEGLARHVLLLAVLLDGTLLPRERVEMLLELHGNAMLRERAAVYLAEKARQLEAMVVDLAGGGARGGAGVGDTDEAEALRGLTALRQILDLSLLKFQEKDHLVEALQKWRTTVLYDMVKAWDARARKWYGDRYDFRRNLVDWDYHMRLQTAGTPGQDPGHGSIIHFHHFRHWRMHGVAHELRDSHYNQPNRSLLSTAYGRTREFKDRSLRDVGRSVSAWGFWADVLNGPYHCFGTLTEEPSFYKVTNKQYSRTAVDVAEHNVASLLHELRTGERLTLAAGSEAPRAKVARGPTSLEDLQQQVAAEEQPPQQPPHASEKVTKKADTANTVDPSTEGRSGCGCAGTGSSGGPPDGICEGASGQGETVAAEVSPGSCREGEAFSSSEPPPPPPPPSPPPPPPPPPPDFHTQPPGEPSSPPQREELPPPPQQQQQQQQQQHGQPGAITTYSSGGRASAAKVMNSAAADEPQLPPAAAQMEQPSAGAAAAATAAISLQKGSACGACGGGRDAAGEDGGIPDAAKQRMAEEEAALRAAEAVLDCAGRSRVSSMFRLQLVTGDLAKAVTGRAKYGGVFSVLTLGHRHIHMLAPEYGLYKTAMPGAVLVAENARHVLQLNKEQAALFVTKMDELAEQAGWRKVAAGRPGGITEANEVYIKPRSA
ncbi:hypothetical protein Vretimale_9197 [Volvox reticuliferus]|uniref:Dynein assembly factor 3, axonemal n=1 Tax=Volvox reticuliferus TaxID=1737510 RepID=A0A8J4CF95_9CHLO|nr:hypothetical protein Vretifemale_9963 [Volvox reticuliferus]GIM04710.1 hypothetical protein Vretimale_9197 [Volvox reticuliferus]